MLELLVAYDKDNSKTELLSVAKSFSDWIFDLNDEALPYAIKELNRLQVIKRIRAFTKEEIKKVYSIIQNKESTDIILVGAYLLLDQQPLAEIHFERLDETLKDEFKTYPIYHFGKLRINKWTN